MDLDTKFKCLTITASFAACLSFIGSFSTIRRILKEHKWGSYSRLMISLSCFDILQALILPLTAILHPSELTQFSWAIGNSSSCVAQAFLLQLSTGSVLYNAALSVFFLAVVKYGISEKILAKFIEPWLHLVAAGYSVGTASYGLFRGLYGPLHGIPLCFLKEPSEVYLFKGAPTSATLMALLVNNFLIYIHVRGRIKRSQRYSLEKNQNISSFFITGSVTKNKNFRVQLVGSQAFFYVGFFILTNIWITILIGMYYTNPSQFETVPRPAYLNALFFLNRVFQPLQGFWNAVIFARPRYMKYYRRRKVPRTSRIRAFWWALFGPQHDERIPTPGARGDAFSPNDSILATINLKAFAGGSSRSLSFPSKNNEHEICFYREDLEEVQAKSNETDSPTSPSTIEYSDSFSPCDVEMGEDFKADLLLCEGEEDESSNSSVHSTVVCNDFVSNSSDEKNAIEEGTEKS